MLKVFSVKCISKLLFVVGTMSFSIAMADVPKISCVSKGEVIGWAATETRAKLRLSAKLASDMSLEEAEISGAYFPDTAKIEPTSVFDSYLEGFRNVSASTHKVYGPLVDNWFSFFVILPKGVETLANKGKFKALISVLRDEDGDKVQDVEMDCKVLRR